METVLRPKSAKPTPLIMEGRPHPEQGYRACIGILRQTRHYGAERLEAACGIETVTGPYHTFRPKPAGPGCVLTWDLSDDLPWRNVEC